MSDPQVTITLGRTGQVVTKGGKRFSDGFLSANKRQRGDGITWNPGPDGANGSRISRSDLRLKLIRKRKSKKVHNAVEVHNKMVLQDKNVLKSVQPPMSSHLPPYRHESNESCLSGGTIPNQIAAHHGDSSGRYHSSQINRGPRDSSPDRIVKISTDFLPPRSINEMQPGTWMRTADVSRGGQFFSNEVLDASGLSNSAIITMKTSQSVNPVTRVAPHGVMQKVLPMGEEPLTVSSFLHSLGLGKYAINFQAEEVDMLVLKQMQDNDLKEMGIPMGPRKKILLALLPHQKQRTTYLK